MGAFLASTLVNSSGDGLYIAGSALFFTRGLRLPVAEVGLGLTCAGLIGLTAGVPLGRLADRRGSKEVLIAIQLVQALAIGSYLLVGRSFWAFVVVATLCIAGMQGADAARGALVGHIAAEDPVRLRALLQSVSNIGISLGTVLAGFAIAAGTHLAYSSLMLGDAVSFLLAAALLFKLPRPVTTQRANQPGGRRRSTAVWDRAYLALTATNCLMALQYFVLAFAMPLWVIGHTRAPHWLVSPMLLANTVLVVLLQVRFSRGSKTPVGGARSIRKAGFVLAAAMALYSAASGASVPVAILVLSAAAIVHTVGELLQSAGAFGISYGLARESALGEYLAVYGLGLGVCRAVAPGVLAATCLAHGTAGWLGLAALFAASGALTPLLVRAALTSRRRPHADASTEVETLAEPAVDAGPCAVAAGSLPPRRPRRVRT